MAAAAGGGSVAISSILLSSSFTKKSKFTSRISLSFKNRLLSLLLQLEGSFLKKDIPNSFWAFFPDGVLSDVSTVESFPIDEKKITTKHVVFWVEKRLAAQGIIPVWKD